jgi:hypothetical protein
VIDEARHVETYSRLLQENFDLAYPVTPPLKGEMRSQLRAAFILGSPAEQCAMRSGPNGEPSGARF